MVLIVSMEMGLDPNNSIIKRLRCINSKWARHEKKVLWTYPTSQLSDLPGHPYSPKRAFSFVLYGKPRLYRFKWGQ